MRRLAAPTLLALALLAWLGACNGPPAPGDRGVCWKVDPAAKSRYAPLAKGVDSLEACAVLLEAMRLRGQAQSDGAYQGYFLFIGPDAMSSALHVHGVRYPIFQPPQRRVLDREITRMMAEHGGRMPSPDEFSLEHSRP
ncbi:MAG TPA: hypothetical protein VFE13_01070 [Caulobacteraceae bacterium]|jgi:hypothetical protein|nr:hypothetical protein [Caulobacteraceae bacterium]